MHTVTRALAHRYEADPKSAGRARADLAGFASRAGASATLVDGVRLAVSEAVSNVVQHAYTLDSGEVRVRALADEDVLKVVVSDDGRGVQRDSRRDGGLGFGLALICEVSDQMTLAPRPQGGVDLRMRFSLLASSSAWIRESAGQPA